VLRATDNTRMLVPEQVVAFLVHPDSLVREQATRYFDHAHDPAPLTADGVWEAMDRLEDSDSFRRHVMLLPRVAGSDAATARLLAALDEDRLLEAEEDLWDAVYELDFEQLRRHGDAIFARVDRPDESGVDLRADVREHLRARLALADAPLEDLWGELARLAEETKDQYWDQIDHSRFDRLIEAIARGGEGAARRAVAFLEDSANRDDPREVFVIKVLQELKHRPALDLLVGRFADAGDEDDVLHETLMYAIPVVGGADAVAAVEARFPTEGETFRIYGSELLGRVKHPAAEAAVLRLIERPECGDAREHLAAALGDLLATDGLPVLRRIVLGGEYDPKMFDLDRDLVVCSLMAGYEFPELGGLREEVVAREVEFERRREAGEFPDLEEFAGLMNERGLGGMEDTRDLLDQYGGGGDDLPAPPPELDDRYPPVVAPIRNAEPKVGRNDPCPCGSGKKYKKCCLGK
jgi:hypothetical protein